MLYSPLFGHSLGSTRVVFCAGLSGVTFLNETANVWISQDTP